MERINLHEIQKMKAVCSVRKELALRTEVASVQTQVRLKQDSWKRNGRRSGGGMKNKYIHDRRGREHTHRWGPIPIHLLNKEEKCVMVSTQEGCGA